MNAILKVAGEVALGALAYYGVHEHVEKTIKDAKPESVVDGFKSGAAVAALAIGAAVIWPVTASIGAAKLGRKIYTRRAEIKDQALRVKGRITKIVVTRKNDPENIETWFAPEHREKVTTCVVCDKHVPGGCAFDAVCAECAGVIAE